MDKPKIGDEVVVREQESRASKGFGCVGARLNDCVIVRVCLTFHWITK